MFDYQGLSPAELDRLCDKSLSTHNICKTKYNVSELYSIGRYLRGMAAYPSWLSLYVYTQHGAGGSPEIAPHELDNDAEAMLVFNTDSFENYRKLSSKPCHLVTMPYVWYRRKHNITADSSAKGVLVFPSHSTSDIDIVFDVEAYARELRSLPPEFSPVCLCLHRSDIVKGLHHEFIKRGFPVYTAGDPFDIYFGDRLYDLLRRFRFTMSNHVGSYAYYSVEMGLPFSLFGSRCLLVNKSDPNLPVGVMDLSGNKFHIQAERVFSGLQTQVTPEQKELVEHVLGIGQGLNGVRLHEVLMEAYNKKRGCKYTDALRGLHRKIKRDVLGRTKRRFQPPEEGAAS